MAHLVQTSLLNLHIINNTMAHDKNTYHISGFKATWTQVDDFCLH